MAACSAPAVHQGSDPEIEKKVEQTLSRMTLDEKVGQMMQLTVDAVCRETADGFELDSAKLQRAIAEYKVGSFLNAPGPVAQTPEWWHRTISQIQELSLKEMGIPTLYGLDQIHGTTYTLGGILFPQNINLAASFNVDLATESGRVTAYETRAGGCPWVFSPTVDMARDPRWSRVWENFGEDCLVNGVMGSALVRGLQGDRPNHVNQEHVGACVKHYLGYSMARTGKDRTPAYISESDLREKCFQPFKACVEAGVLSIMVNSGSINGMPVHASHRLLTEWLKEDLQWDGMLITDWADINNLYTREHVAADKKEAICMAINAGIDMAMEPYDLDFCTLLKELVEEGRVSQARIDDAVRRILRLKYRLGLFDAPVTSASDYPLFSSSLHAEAALRAAEESEVLLKNDGQLLPLAEGKRLLVCGPNAHAMRPLNGGWSYTWQGHLADRFASEYQTIYEALAERFGASQVRHVAGVSYKAEGSYQEEETPDIAAAVRAAAWADVIVACVGENSYCETPGNLTDLALSASQRDLVRALAQTGKPIVLVINSGRPRLVADIEPYAQAVIDVLLPGNYGGEALARILAGDVNPSARLPYTYPRHSASLTTYDYRVSETVSRMEGAYDYDALVDVQWPFGYGLSYTEFTYSNLQCSAATFEAGDTLTLTVDVQNSGQRFGRHSVLLYSSDEVASLTPESRRLRAFTKIALQPGEQTTVRFSLPATDLAFVGADGCWVLEAGRFVLQCGSQTLPVECLRTERFPQRH